MGFVSHVIQITYEMKVMVGEANMVICEAAKTLCVDLLVVGNHEYGGLKRYTNDFHFTIALSCLRS